MKQTCILVLGMHRSGTSALSGVLNTLGISMGKQLLVTPTDNPKGHFENERIMYFNDQSLLPLQESSWDDLKRLSVIFDSPELVECARTIIQEDYEGLEIFGIKDPRMCVLMPFWKPVLEQSGVEVKMILPYRHPLEVACSLHKRNGFSMEKGLLLWARHVLYAEYYSRGCKRVFTTYQNLLNHTQSTLKCIEETLEVRFPLSSFETKEALNSFLEKEFKHHEARLEELPKTLPPFILETAYMYDALGNDLLQDNEETLQKFDTMREQYEHYTALFYNQDVPLKQPIRHHPVYFIQLFFDLGNGFNEENSIKLPVQQTADWQEFIFDVSNTSSFQGLRLDPLNECCVIELKSLHVKKENEMIDLMPYVQNKANANHDKIYFFTTDDPFLHFSGFGEDIFQKALAIVMTVRYVHRGKDALHVKLAEQEKELNALKEKSCFKILKKVGLI